LCALCALCTCATRRPCKERRPYKERPRVCRAFFSPPPFPLPPHPFPLLLLLTPNLILDVSATQCLARCLQGRRWGVRGQQRLQRRTSAEHQRSAQQRGTQPAQGSVNTRVVKRNWTKRHHSLLLPIGIPTREMHSEGSTLSQSKTK